MKAKKHLGQNFLTDESLISQIIDYLHLKQSDQFIEIGPGQGAVTCLLAPKIGQLDLIELDPDMIAILEKKLTEPHVTIHHQDALTLNLAQLKKDKPIRVFGNLPYNISTPIIFHLLAQLEHIQDLHFTLQKEVVERIVAEPGSKQYGRLSVMVQSVCDTTPLLSLPAEAFDPAPKVDSLFFRMVPHQRYPLSEQEIKQLATTVQTAFNQRRKTLRKIFSKQISKEQFDNVGIDSGLRPEQLTVQQFIELSKVL